MKSYKDHLKEQLANPEFKSLYEDEKYLLELGLKIAEKRQQLDTARQRDRKKCKNSSYTGGHTIRFTP